MTHFLGGHSLPDAWTSAVIPMRGRDQLSRAVFALNGINAFRGYFIAPSCFEGTDIIYKHGRFALTFSLNICSLPPVPEHLFALSLRSSDASQAFALPTYLPLCNALGFSKNNKRNSGSSSGARS